MSHRDLGPLDAHAQATPEKATISFSELPESRPDSPIAIEWNAYRGQVERLLTDGKEGKWVLFKGDELIGIYESRDSAVAEGYRRYPRQAFLVHQVRAHEPILRVRGYNLPCPVSITQLAKPASISWRELPDAPPDSPNASEWNHYRQCVAQWLAEGHEGKWVLIKGEELVGMWDTQAEADAVRIERFLLEPVLQKQVLSEEPILRVGFNRLCRN